MSCKDDCGIQMRVICVRHILDLLDHFVKVFGEFQLQPSLTKQIFAYSLALSVQLVSASNDLRLYTLSQSSQYLKLLIIRIYMQYGLQLQLSIRLFNHQTRYLARFIKSALVPFRRKSKLSGIVIFPFARKR